MWSRIKELSTEKIPIDIERYTFKYFPKCVVYMKQEVFRFQFGDEEDEVIINKITLDKAIMSNCQ